MTAARAATSSDIDQALNASDVLAALKLASGRPVTLTQPVMGNLPDGLSADSLARASADINQNGVVDLFDARAILSAAAGLDQRENLEWRFVAQASPPEAESQHTGFAEGTWHMTVDAVSRLDWLGFLMGDVNGSWDPP